MAKHIELGKIGEDIATMFLVKRGFTIVQRNYRKPYGEVDIIAQKANILHFCEVKSVSRVTNQGSGTAKSKQLGHLFQQPEENVHFYKRQRVSRAIQAYLLETRHTTEVNWQFDIIGVFIDKKNHRVQVKYLPNIII